MKSVLIFLTENIKKEPNLNERVLKDILSELDFNPPNDYWEFIKEFNGGEGFIGTQNYLSLWKVDNLIDWNKKYDVDLYAPGYFIFASDGGGTAYAFNKKDGSIVAFQFIGMLMDDNPVILGDTFTVFLNSLYQESGV